MKVESQNRNLLVLSTMPKRSEGGSEPSTDNSSDAPKESTRRASSTGRARAVTSVVPPARPASAIGNTSSSRNTSLRRTAAASATSTASAPLKLEIAGAGLTAARVGKVASFTVRFVDSKTGEVSVYTLVKQSIFQTCILFSSADTTVGCTSSFRRITLCFNVLENTCFVFSIIIIIIIIIMVQVSNFHFQLVVEERANQPMSPGIQTVLFNSRKPHI